MKAALVILGGALIVLSASAQYKAPSQYFRKDFPAPKPGAQPAPNAPQQHHTAGSPQVPAAAQAPAQPSQPKFKDVGTNAQFYFLTDTNHMYPWTKISATVATNSKNGARQSFSPEMPVQR